MWINGTGLMVELVQIAGMKARMAEQALAANPHLLFIGLVFQPRELCIEPVQKVRIIRVKDKKPHIKDL
jgi:hypothetical protein